jgi:ATP-binding cassette subfamily B protein
LTLSENIFADGRNVEERLRELLAVLPNDFIAKLPHGATTQLGTSFGGIDLSGGQWQRVAILRGMAKVHDVFLVDEPTASIDPIEEANVFESIGKQKCNITILVTHRLGSIRKATKILVIKDGGLIAEGGHELLINECEYYEKMYKSQAEMYDEKKENNDEAIGV